MFSARVCGVYGFGLLLSAVLICDGWSALGENKAAEQAQPGKDLYGDPLPNGAVLRLGTIHLRHAAEATCVSFAPDGKTIASASKDQTVAIWDAVTGEQLRSL